MNKNLLDIKIMLQNMDRRLQKVESKNDSSTIEFRMLEKYLPIKNIEMLVNFNEELLTNEELNSQYKLYLHSIGGNSHKDYLNRVWIRTLSNEMGMKCSWLGRKHNINVSVMELTKIIKEQFLTDIKDANERDFETISSDWLRQSKTRFERGRKVNPSRLIL